MLLKIIYSGNYVTFSGATSGLDVFSIWSPGSFTIVTTISLKIFITNIFPTNIGVFTIVVTISLKILITNILPENIDGWHFNSKIHYNFIIVPLYSPPIQSTSCLQSVPVL